MYDKFQKIEKLYKGQRAGKLDRSNFDQVTRKQIVNYLSVQKKEDG
jgi:hypothetical protein